MISNTSSTHGTPPPSISPERGRKPAATPPPSSDVLSTNQAEQLRSALAAEPEIRPEVVERGMHLAVDPLYPPREIIENVAKLMVDSTDLTGE